MPGKVTQVMISAVAEVLSEAAHSNADSQETVLQT